MMSVDQMTQEWTDWQGQIINHRFELGQYLGGSEYSAVFLTAGGPGNSQEIAIKLIRADHEDAKGQLSRWESLRALSHPHIIRILESGECSVRNQRLLYVAMEYAEETLSSLLPSRPLTPEEAREMLDPTLDALSYIHAQGLVHGHIKPTNLMAVGETLKLASDGITAAGEQTLHWAKSSPYIAPEGEKVGVSAAGDVWSLGITLVEALTQKRPVVSSSPETQKILWNLPSPFRKVAQCCLRPDPNQRCTISDIQREMHPVPPIGTASSGRGTVDAPRRRGLFAPVATLISLAIIAGLFFFSRHRSSSDSSQPQTQHEVSPVPSQTRTVPVEPAKPSSVGADKSGTVIRRVLPDVSKNALRTVQGTVRVRVRMHVDPSGNVDRARLESGGPSRYFASKSLEAARQWKFEAPSKNGKGVSSDWDAEFQFNNRSSKVREKQANP